MTGPTDDEFRSMLAKRGLRLDDKAFVAALTGARHLKAEVERLRAYLGSRPDPSA